MKLKQYPKYKDSGVQWIGEIPERWNVKRIKDNLRFEIGGTPPTGKEEYYDGDNLWVSIADMKNNPLIIDTKSKISKEGILNSNVKKIPKGSLLFSFKLSVGYVSFSDVDLYTNEAIASFLVNKKIDLHYLKYVLKQDFEENGFENIYGAKLFNKDLIGFAKHVLPETDEEQTQIANFLDRKTLNISQTIEKDKKLIKLLKEKRIALINHVVTKGLDKNAKMKPSGIDWIGEIPEGWKVKKLKFIADVKVSNVDKKSVIGEPEVKLCNYTDVYYNEYITSKIDFMKRTCSPEQKNKFMLEKGDVMITKDSETADDIAVPAVSKEKFSDVVCGYHLSFIRPKQEIIGGFLFRLFQSKLINSHFEIWALGVTRFGVSAYPIKNSLMILPPKQTQLQIVQYLDAQTTKIDQTISKIQEKITLMEEYKKSLIHHVVTGKVDVRGVEI